MSKSKTRNDAVQAMLNVAEDVPMNGNLRIALLIDAENVPAKYARTIMEELSEFGFATYRRVYGNNEVWKVKGWRETMRTFALAPAYQENNSRGKSSTDSAMIIDAMDILHTGDVDAFCIVSSDGDFTKLAIRLREGGKMVIGMGEVNNATFSLAAACREFKWLNLLYKDKGADAETETKDADGKAEEKKNAGSAKTRKQPAKRSRKTQAAQEVPETESAELFEAESAENENENADAEAQADVASRKKVIETILDIIDSREEDEVILSNIGMQLGRRIPGFDPRNYGFPTKKLRSFIDEFSDVLDIRDVEHSTQPGLNQTFIKRRVK